MTGYRVYRVSNPHYDDFDSKIEDDRLVLVSKHFLNNGLEAGSELYDEEGNLVSRTAIRYNEKNAGVEHLEFMGSETTPFKITLKDYNERGQLTTTGIYYDGEEPLVDLNTYDEKGRLLQATHIGDDGNEETNLYTYEGDCPKPATHSFFMGNECMHESRFTYEGADKEFGLIEEIYEDKTDPYKSRVRRFYDNGEIPNHVIDEEYNLQGDFLEECREVQDGKGNTLQRTWHTGDEADYEPYMNQSFVYDNENRVIMERHMHHGINIYINRIKYDYQGRKIREHLFQGTTDEITIFKYDE